MIKEIMHDAAFLSIKSSPATAEDMQTVQDMRDTLKAHSDSCVGMAANMIGVLKNIIIFDSNGTAEIMLNPEIIKQSGRYETEEGCLSLSGSHKAVRYRSIKVRWQDEAMKTRIKTFEGWTAQIIQHEIDHCNGILV